MKSFIVCALSVTAFCLVQSIEAQPPGERGPGEGQPNGGPPNGGPPDRERPRGSGNPNTAVEKMMQLDVNEDRILTVAEVNDARLENLLTRADKDTDGKITIDELTALFTAEAAQMSIIALVADRLAVDLVAQAARDLAAPGGFGGPGRGMRRPGEIIPPFMQDELQLTESQRSELAELQSEVESRLKKILTEDQLQRISQPPGPPQGRGPGQGGPPGGGVGGGRNENRPPQE